MRTYIIGNDGITRCREPPAAVNEGEIVVASNEEFHAARLSGKRLLALWNAHAAGGQHLLDHAQAQREPKIQPGRVADDLSGVAMAGVNRVSRRPHPARLLDQPGSYQARSRPT
jgi:hypothetical protein